MTAARRYLSLMLVLIFVIYVTSYLALSRSGYAAAERDGSEGFYYFELENADAWRRKNRICFYLFWPLNWIDCWLGFGREPGSEPLMELGDFGQGTPNSSLALRVS